MLKIKNISKIYQSKNGEKCKALNDLSIHFGSTGLTFISGKSGSGKSTLLNVIGGLDKVDSGEIIIKNKSSKLFSNEDFDSYRSTYLGFVFQDFNILENFTVEENIALPLKLQNYKKEDINKKVEDIINKVGLSGLSKRASNELSGGQLQRVAIARALVKDPVIILADEPTGNLDSETGIQIMNILKELSKDKLVIIVSHDIEYANIYADRIIELKDGSITEDYEVTRMVTERKITKKKLITKENVLDLSNKKFNLTKTKLPFKYVFKTAVKNLLNKKIKLALTIFLFVVSLFTLSLSTLLSDFDISVSTINTMEMNQVDNLLVRKCQDFHIDYSEIFSVNECNFKRISQLETETIDSISKDLDSEPYRLINQGFPLPIDKSIYIKRFDIYTPQKIFGFIEVPEDNIFEIIDGRYPVNSGEAMITEYLVESVLKFLEITRDELIGSTFKYGKTEYIITGVIDTDHEKYLHLKDVDIDSMSFEELSELQRVYHEYLLKTERLYSRFFIPIEPKNNDEINFVDNVKFRSNKNKFLGYINFRTDLDESLMTKENVKTYPSNLEPLGENGIYIDLYLFLERKLSFEDDIDMSKFEINKVLNDLSIMDQFLGKEHLFRFENNDAIFEEYFTIKGFYIPDKSTEDYKSKELKNGIIVNREITSKLINPTYDGYYLTLSNSKDKNIKLFKTLEDNGYIQITPYSDYLYLVYGLTKDLHEILIYTTIGLAIFACVLIFVSISNSINNKQKDIGILRSIGTSGSDVASIFLIESVLLAAISITLATIIAYLATQFINITLMNYYKINVLFFHFGIKQITYVTIFALFMTFISTLTPIRRLLMMKPIDVVRKK